MTTLLQRLEGAGGPDRELDAILAETLGQVPAYCQGRMFGLPEKAAFVIDGGRAWTAPRYTASLDAAIALAEACGLSPFKMLAEAMRVLKDERGAPSKASDLTWELCQEVCIAIVRARGEG